MSIPIHRSHITTDQAKYIAKSLQLVPKKKFIPGKKGYDTDSSAMPMYYKDGDYVNIPYTFAKGYFNIKPEEKPSISGLQFLFTLRPEQEPKVLEAWEHITTKGTTTLQLDTAYGKTIISVYLATLLSKLTLVIHPGQTLHKQWVKAFKEATNASDTVWDIYKKQPENTCVIVSTVGMLSHIPQYLMDNIGTLIIDETHKMISPSTLPGILSIRPQYIIGSSYTYEKTDGTHEFMDMVLGLHRVKGKLDMIIHAIRLNTNFTYEVPRGKMGVDYTALIDLLVKNDERNKFICNLVVSNIHRKIVVLTPRVDHAKLLSEMLNGMGIESDYITGKKKKYQNSNVLVGSIGKINTGFDEANYCESFDGIPLNVLINVGSNTEHNLIVQIVGRLKRSKNVEPYLIDIVDDCSIFNRHAKERKKIYKEEGYKIYEIENQIPVLP